MSKKLPYAIRGDAPMSPSEARHIQALSKVSLKLIEFFETLDLPALLAADICFNMFYQIYISHHEGDINKVIEHVNAGLNSAKQKISN